MCVSRSERFTSGRYGRPTDPRRLEELVFANRSEVVISAFDSDFDSDGSETEEEEQPQQREKVAGLAATRGTAPLGRSPEFIQKAKSYDSDVLDELVLDTESVVVPTGGGAWIPVRRRRLSDRGEREEPLFQVEDHESRRQDERQPSLIPSSEIAVPLLRGPEVISGIWPVDSDKGLVVVVNPDGDDLCLTDGDRVAAVMPAALQTRTCTLCGLVDTDGFSSDVEMCGACGTLVPRGPSPCAGCGAGVDYIHTQLYACCKCCKGLVQPVEEGTEKGLNLFGGTVGPQDPKVNPCFYVDEARSVTTRWAPAPNHIGHIIEEPGGINQMVDCEVPPEEYDV